MEQSATQRPTRRNRARFWTDSEGVLGSLFLMPAVVYIVALVGIPFFLAIAFSLSSVTVGDTSLHYVGLENYRAIWKTPQFQRALKNTFLFTIVSQVLIIVLSTILAEVLYVDFRGKWIARMLIMHSLSPLA